VIAEARLGETPALTFDDSGGHAGTTVFTQATICMPGILSVPPLNVDWNVSLEEPPP
jgi:hypothetical protein